MPLVGGLYPSRFCKRLPSEDRLFYSKRLRVLTERLRDVSILTISMLQFYFLPSAGSTCKHVLPFLSVFLYESVRLLLAELKQSSLEEGAIYALVVYY